MLMLIVKPVILVIGSCTEMVSSITNPVRVYKNAVDLPSRAGDPHRGECA